MKYSAQNKLKQNFWYSAIAMLAVTLICFILSPDSNNMFTFDDNQKYIMQLVSIVTLILVPLAIAFFNKKLEKADKNNKKSFDKLYITMGVVRSTATTLCTIINAAAYFLIDYKSAMYCVIIGFAAHAYCYPSRKEYDALLNGESTK